MILDEIAAATRLRVEQLQRIKDLNKIRSDAESLPKKNCGSVKHEIAAAPAAS